MAEETLAQKLRVGGFSFKDEAKLAEAIEAFESEYLGNIVILSEEERKNLPRGKQLIQRQIRQFVQNTVRTYKQEKRRRAQQEEDNDDIFE